MPDRFAKYVFILFGSLIGRDVDGGPAAVAAAAATAAAAAEDAAADTAVDCFSSALDARDDESLFFRLSVI